MPDIYDTIFNPVKKSSQDIAPPAMDRLANVAKFSTVPNDRQGSSNSNRPINDIVANPNQDKALNWLDDWIKRENIKRELLGRSPESLQMEKNLGLKPLTNMMTGKPSSQMEELGVGFDQGLNYLKQMAAGLGAYVGVPGADDTRKMHEERGNVMAKYRERSNPEKKGFSGGDIVNKAIQLSPEVANPLRVGRLVKPIVARAGNAIFHAIRGGAANQSLEDAALAAASNLLGEKAEDLVSRDKGLAGNLVGTGFEEAYNRLFK